ncbi:MAG: mechanosensitive ion channel domain-containing protein [Planctomycetota bacterium]
MPISRSCRVAFVLWLHLFATGVIAQDQAEEAAENQDKAVAVAGDTLTIESVKSALAAAEGNDQLPPEVTQHYTDAIESLKKEADFKSRAEEFSAFLETGPSVVEKTRAELNSAKQEPASSVGDIALDEIETEQLQRNLDAERARASELADASVKATAEATRVKGRPVEISQRLLEVQREITEATEGIQKAEASDSPSAPKTAASLAKFRAAKRRLASEQLMLEKEQLGQSIRDDLLAAQQALASLRVERANASVIQLQAALNDRLSAEARKVTASIPVDLPEHPVIQDLVAEVKELANEFAFVVASQKQLTPKTLQVTTFKDGLVEQYEGVQNQLTRTSGGPQMSRILFRLGDLAEIDSSEFAIDNVVLDGEVRPALTLDQVQLQSFQLLEKGRKRSGLESRLRELTLADEDREKVETLLTNRAELLETLRSQYSTVSQSLSAFESKCLQLDEKAAEVRQYVKEQLFGFRVRSCAPISFGSFAEIPAGVSWCFQGAHWRELQASLVGVWTTMPLRTTLALGLVALLLAGKWRNIRQLTETGVKIKRFSQDRFSYTFQALILTALLALPMPLLLGYIAWALDQTSGQGDWIRGVRLGLWHASWVIMTTQFLIVVCRKGGLGEAHFGWPAEALAKTRAALYLFSLVYAPALLLFYSCTFGEASQYLGSVSRIVFLATNAWVLFVLWRLFGGANGVLALIRRDVPNHLMTRWRNVWCPVLLALPVVLSVIACLGYLVTANSLGLGIVITFAILGIGEIVYALARRWFMIRERRLALTEALERRRARALAESCEDQDEESEVFSIDDADLHDELDLASLGGQTRSLLRLVCGLAVLATMVFFWTGIFPLGQAMAEVTVPFTKFNLLSVMQATLITVVAYFVVRNLPGLLELGILRATQLGSGARNAITTLVQYGVIALAAVMTFNVLALDWEKFGWMAAALSVGLGFGLQEVVANFVCGVILLFEQPIRIGDIVTVDGTTGTVTRIHMRATTITNWDRQELVVPNKNLITGTILNWTLTATVNRVVIPVGVSYGCDTETARQILLDVAAEHDSIMDDPAPIASVEQFGDSTINMMLRAYLPDLSNRISVTTELHNEIVQRFTDAGIEIPFPQQDLHVRSGVDAVLRGGDAELATEG